MRTFAKSRQRKSSENDINKVMRAILAIPGQKIVTMTNVKGDDITIDVSADGVWGYEPGHMMLFASKLATAFFVGGGITVRQFLAEKMPNGLPKKRVYGIFLAPDGRAHSLTSEQVREAYIVNAVTGEPVPEEPGVEYGTIRL